MEILYIYYTSNLLLSYVSTVPGSHSNPCDLRELQYMSASHPAEMVRAESMMLPQQRSYHLEVARIMWGSISLAIFSS